MFYPCTPRLLFARLTKPHASWFAPRQCFYFLVRARDQYHPGARASMRNQQTGHLSTAAMAYTFLAVTSGSGSYQTRFGPGCLKHLSDGWSWI